MESLCGIKSVDPDLLTSSDLNLQDFQNVLNFEEVMVTVPLVCQICYSVSKQNVYDKYY